jgi:DNA-directed RNA polymerase specialized sigma subunit
VIEDVSIEQGLRDKGLGGSMPSKNPVEAILEEKNAAAVGKQQKELALWEQWRKGGQQPEHLEPLLDLYQPLVRRKAVEWGPPMIPKPALEAEITKHVIAAFETYNPERGAALNTHVQHRIQKAKRFVAQHQNIAYIPEPQTYQIGKIQRAGDVLTQELGRAPTHAEIADHLGMSVKNVSRIQKAMLRDVPGSMLETDPVPKLSPREQEVLSLLPAILTPEEKAVFDHIYHPDPSQRITSTTELAAKLGKNPSQISRVKTSLINKTKQYI